MSEIQVREHSTVSVCIQSWSVRVQQKPALVLVTTQDGTAKGLRRVIVCVWGGGGLCGVCPWVHVCFLWYVCISVRWIVCAIHNVVSVGMRV